MAKKKTTTKNGKSSNGASVPPDTDANGVPEATDDQVKVDYFEQQLRTKLTKDERIAKAEVLVEKLTERDAVELEMKAEAAKHRLRIKEIEAEANAVMADVQTGTEERTVRCVEVRNYRTGSVTTRRTDTHEVLDERPMEERERQLELDVADDDQPPPSSDDPPTQDPPEGEGQATKSPALSLVPEA